MKKKILGLSTALALAGVASTAQAVNISEDGLGQVLLFPYYTVNGDFDTYINITNTSDQTAMFKIRFREGHNSRDARDFNVILSPYDVWTATVTKAENGNPRIQTTDTTCTAPRLPIISGNLRGIEFTNLDYSNPGTGGADRRDGGGTSIARTEQGHFEVILMGLSNASTSSGSSTVAYKAKHVVDSNGVSAPRDCNGIVNQFNSNFASIQSEFNAMGNVLKGSASLLKAGQGKATGYDPVVLANWRSAPQVNRPEDAQPHLNDTLPALADTLDSVQVGYGSFTRGVDAVSALLMATGVINQFSVNPAANVATDWVVTFPTKNFYVDTLWNGGAPVAPFVENFQTGNNGLSCMSVVFNYFDREERSPEETTELNFSPVPPGAPGNALCKETNVVTFNNSNVLGAGDISVNVNLDDGYNNGWMDLRFTNSQDLEDNDGFIWEGLPVIGFALTTREDGVSGSENLSYGTSWNHAYYRSVTEGPSSP